MTEYKITKDQNWKGKKEESWPIQINNKWLAV